MHVVFCRAARRSWRRKRRYACLVADDKQLGVVGSCSIALNSPEAVSSKQLWLEGNPDVSLRRWDLCSIMVELPEVVGGRMLVMVSVSTGAW